MYTNKNNIHTLTVPSEKIERYEVITGIDSKGKPARETIESMYKRLNPKPDIIINGGLFDFKSAAPVTGVKSRGIVHREQSSIELGFSVCFKDNKIDFLTHNKSKFSDVVKNYNDAIESAPLLLPQLIANKLTPSLVTEKHIRAAIGFDEKNSNLIIAATQNKVTCKELSNALKLIGATVALNLDGGGSTKIYYQGNQLNKNDEKRPITSAIAIWFKKESQKGSDNMEDFDVVIDPGHGGKDPGALDGNKFEKDYNLKISLYQYERFKQLGIKCALTRDSDEYLDSTPRTNKVKSFKPKLCISNHINAAASSTAAGFEIIYSIHETDKFPKMVSEELKKSGAIPRSTPIYTKTGSNPKSDYYYMIRQTRDIETIIVEYDFITNPTSVRRLDDNWMKYAEAVVKATAEYLKHKYVAPNAPTPKKKIYRVQVGAFKAYSNAETLWKELRSKGFSDCFIKTIDGFYKVQVGAFSVEKNAKDLKTKLEKLNHKPFIFEEVI